MTNKLQQEPTRVVAKYLLDHGYLNTLEALSHDAAIAIDQLDLDDPEAVTLEALLEERRLRELSLQLEQAKLAETELPAWIKSGCPAQATALSGLGQANVLFVTGAQIDGQLRFLVSTGNRMLTIFDADKLEIVCRLPQASPVLEARVIQGRFLLTGNMGSAVDVTDLKDTAQHSTLAGKHTLYVHRLLVNRSETHFVSTGYDKQLHLYRINPDAQSPDSLCQLVASEQLPSVAEGICFVQLDGQEHLAIARRDSCFIEYLSLKTLQVVHRLNMNANKDTWVSFTGVDLAIRPSSPSLLGVATSKAPFGRWLAFEGDTSNLPAPDAKADIHHGAAVSDLGVLPRFAWRPDGSGFFVGSDDGVVRGVCIKTGRVVATLQGHTAAIRSLWCGWLADGREVLITGSFDKSALVWRAETL